MKHFSIVMLLFLALAPACDRGASSAPAKAKVFRVAVVAPGSTADGGWNYSAREAAARVERELRLAEPVSFVENVEASKRKALLRDFGRDGYALVICHGYEFNPVVREIAGEYPATFFVVSGYDRPEEKFGSIVYQLGEAAYLCGAMAAKVTRTGQVGFIAAAPVPPVELCYRGFRAGFLAFKPDGAVREPVYIEGARPWEDSTAAKAKTAALLQVREPAPIDVLFQNADAASRGVFEAVEAHAGPVFVFGANRDQNDTPATRKVLASAVIHVDRAFVRLAGQVLAGEYKPHLQTETVASGVIECVLSPRLAELVGEPTAAACKAAVEEARRALIDGKVSLSGA
ncbi:MAG: BMP family ABC transporter substrate-binding protein [Phycisphaerae bacterium]|jgi:basic membrane lipoprotein Med (substrate-binding protein (PBP1-ABC) superfamily)